MRRVITLAQNLSALSKKDISVDNFIVGIHMGRKPIHGLSHTPEYAIWYAIKKRCYNEADGEYENYGGRGITMCDEWRDSFEAFYRDMGARPSPEYSIDRRENDGNYEPNNCRWATVREQANNRRTNVLYEYRGERRTLPEWSRELGINLYLLKNRIRYGWTLEEIVNTPDRINDQYVFEFNGETKPLIAWCQCFGVRYEAIRRRLKRGIEFVEAIRLSIVDKLFVFEGVEKTLRHWCDMLAMDLVDTSRRIMHGETLESLALE